MTGRQIAACMAMGAAGVWTGSVWLATVESETTETFREKMALHAKENGHRLLAITSLSHTRAVPAGHSSGKKLADLGPAFLAAIHAAGVVFGSPPQDTAKLGRGEDAQRRLALQLVVTEDEELIRQGTPTAVGGLEAADPVAIGDRLDHDIGQIDVRDLDLLNDDVGTPAFRGAGAVADAAQHRDPLDLLHDVALARVDVVRRAMAERLADVGLDRRPDQSLVVIGPDVLVEIAEHVAIGTKSNRRRHRQIEALVAEDHELDESLLKPSFV